MSKATKIWIVAAVALVAVLAAGIWFGRPAYHNFKERRSLAQAREFAEKGDYRNAVLSLRVALGINPSNVNAARMMADLLDRGGSPAAVAWRKRVMELEPIIDNKIMFAACALRYEQPPFPVVEKMLEEIGPSGETNTAYHLVASQLAIKLNRMADVESHLRAAVRLDPTNRQHQLNLATVELQSRDANTAAMGRSKLVALVPDPVHGATALRSLTADCLNRRDLAGAQDYSSRLQALPQATLEDRLLHMTALSDAGNPDLTKFLARVQLDSATNSVMLAQIVAWMNLHKLAKEALDWTSRMSTTNRNALPLPIAEAECYMTLSNWPGLQERLANCRWDEQEFLRLALLARALREQGERENAWRNWRQAVSAAVSRPELTMALLRTARAWGWVEESHELLWAASKRFPSDDWPLSALMQDYSSRNDTEGIYRVFQALLEKKPQSIEFKNNVAALGLLLGRDTTRSTELARQVYDAGKTNATFVSTYAFALHTQGKSVEALKLMQAFPKADLERPEVALYYGVLLAATGQHAQAEPFLAAAEKRHPLAEERTLLNHARQSKR